MINLRNHLKLNILQFYIAGISSKYLGFDSININ